MVELIQQVLVHSYAPRPCQRGGSLSFQWVIETIQSYLAALHNKIPSSPFLGCSADSTSEYKLLGVGHGYIPQWWKQLLAGFHPRTRNSSTHLVAASYCFKLCAWSLAVWLEEHARVWVMLFGRGSWMRRDNIQSRWWVHVIPDLLGTRGIVDLWYLDCMHLRCTINQFCRAFAGA